MARVEAALLLAVASCATCHACPSIPQALRHLFGTSPLPAAAVDVLLQELSGLPKLRVCCLGGLSGRQAAAGGPLLPLLPGGPWLQSLQWLGVSIDALLKSNGVLLEATQLQHLGLWGSSVAIDWGSPAAAALFDWLACHPPLRHLTVDDLISTQVFATSGFFNHCMQLCRRCPDLLVQWPDLQGEQNETVIRRLNSQDPF